MHAESLYVQRFNLSNRLCHGFFTTISCPSCISSIQGLIKSTQRPEQQEGVRLLTEIFRSSPDRRRECLYYLALGNYKLGSYAEARRYNELLVDLEPNNLQAQSLRQLIDDKVAKEGLVGVAIVGGLAVAAGVVGGLIFKGARGSRR